MATTAGSAGSGWAGRCAERAAPLPRPARTAIRRRGGILAPRCALSVLIAAVLPSLAAAASGIFRGAETTAITSNATGVAAADLDGDGRIDVVTGNAGPGGNEILVLFGDGAGGLFGPSRLRLDTLPYGLLLADLDGGTGSDLALAFGDRGTVVVRIGRGDASLFAPPGPALQIGGYPNSLASGDLTGDGLADLVVGGEGSSGQPGSIAVLRGLGGGQFAIVPQPDPEHPGSTVIRLPAGSGTRAVAIGDVTGDGLLDVLALNAHARSVSIYRGLGDGVVAPHDSLPTGAHPADLALADLDGDGYLDLAVAERDADTVSVRFGRGAGGFSAPLALRAGIGPIRVAIADLDGDDVPDLVTANTRSGDVSFVRNSGARAFAAARSYVADTEPLALALADLDGDGLPEVLAAAQGQAGSLAMLRNRGNGVLHAAENVAIGGRPIAAVTADIDGDALTDLIVSRGDGLSLLRARYGGGFAPPIHLPLTGRAVGVVAVDLNGDARPDLAVVDAGHDRVAVALAGVSPGAFDAFTYHAVASDPTAIAAGDFDGDGRVDLAVASIGPPAAVSVLRGTATGFQSARHIELAGAETPVSLVALDANCDGRDDLAVANQATSTVVILHGAGAGRFDVAQTLPESVVGQRPSALAVADFDRDGVADLAIGNLHVPPGGRGVRTLRGNCGSGTFTAHASILAGDTIVALAARDFTGDGVVDIGVVNQAANAVRILAGRGDGTFASSRADAVGRLPVGLIAGDVDGDGRYDAATINADPSSTNASVLVNCVGEPDCPSASASPPLLRGDGNGDGVRSAADLVAVAAELFDGDGHAVEAIGMAHLGAVRTGGGVDANGDGVVTAQDGHATARLLFGAAAGRAFTGSDE